MKKLIVISLLASMLTGSILTGCAGKPAETAPAQEEAVEAPAEAATEGAPAEEAPAEETAEAPAEEAPAEAPAEEAAAEAPAEAAETEGIPAFRYTGEDLYASAIGDYLIETVGGFYQPSDVTLPVLQILKEDESNPDDIRVWGEYWVLNYALRGTTLMERSGGEYPGLFHLKSSGDGFEVTDVEYVQEGMNYDASIDQIFGDLKDAFFQAKEKHNDAVLETVRMYAENTGLTINAVSSFGWDPIPVQASAEELTVEYPDLKGTWNSADGSAVMEVEDPDSGNVFNVEIKQTTAEGKTVTYTLFGEYEMSTNTLYYWNGWAEEDGVENNENTQDGSIAINEDNTLVWSNNGSEGIVFARAE